VEEKVESKNEEEIRKESFLLNRINQAKNSNASSSGNSFAPTSIMRNVSVKYLEIFCWILDKRASTSNFC
jgi:hypothetical protein